MASTSHPKSIFKFYWIREPIPTSDIAVKMGVDVVVEVGGAVEVEEDVVEVVRKSEASHTQQKHRMAGLIVLPKRTFHMLVLYPKGLFVVVQIAILKAYNNNNYSTLVATSSSLPSAKLYP